MVMKQEFVVVRIATSVYVTEVEVMENLNPGTLTRILARYPDGSGYYPLWYGKPVVYSGCLLPLWGAQPKRNFFCLRLGRGWR